MAKRADSKQKKTTKRTTKAKSTPAAKTSAPKSRTKAPARTAARKGGSGGNGQALKSPLSAKELAEFRHMLLQKRQDIMGDLHGMVAVALGPDRETSGGDISDMGSDNFEQEFTLGLLENERAILSEINEALMRIDDGSYGVCLGTHKPISKARLMARPWAKYSIEYTRMLEQGLVRPGEKVLDEDEDEFDDDEVVASADADDDVAEFEDDEDSFDEDLDEDFDDDLAEDDFED